MREDLMANPLQQENKIILFVDGSSYLDHTGIHAGYAVVEKQGDTWVTLEAEKCPQPCSAQLAELKALTRACELMAEQDADIYTDSAYAHGVCHFFGVVWKTRGFQKTDGSEIQHKGQILELIIAMLKPRQTRYSQMPSPQERK